jgi:hypothetical protein
LKVSEKELPINADLGESIRTALPLFRFLYRRSTGRQRRSKQNEPRNSQHDYDSHERGGLSHE